MNKKAYLQPHVEVITLALEDVITTSGNNNNEIMTPDGLSLFEI